MVEDRKGPNTMNTYFTQLIKQTESVHELKLHCPLIAKLSQIIILTKLFQSY